MRSDDAVARCARLVKIYPSATGETHALRGVEATIAGGAVTAVTGPSGSGKSSLLAVLALRERQSGGELWLFGDDVTTFSTSRRRDVLRRYVAWVPQRPTHGLFPHLSAREQVAQVGRLRATSPRTDDVLRRVGLLERADAVPRRLSGGEQQRLAVAVATVGEPRLVVADEPTAELDDESADLVLAELRRCAAAGSAVVCATHDERAMAVADRVLHLRHGVLSSDRDATGEAAVPIDSTGRLQLPPEALRLFPDSRAVVDVADGEVRLRPPDGRSAP
jgi:putative ABC transport system ATP-binding protein